MRAWSVYLLRNERDALYTGVALDPLRRLEEHRHSRSRGAKFTRSCATLEMVYCRELGSRSLALKVERRIKALSKQEKELLVAANPTREFLLERLGLGRDGGSR